MTKSQIEGVRPPMRKAQAERAFNKFCGDLLLITKKPNVFGGKNALVQFDVFGDQYIFYPHEGVARKGERRIVQVFKTARELFAFAKAHDEMKRNDPSWKY